MALIRRKNIWHVDIMIDGQRIRQSTETNDRKLAEKIHAKIYSSIIEGKYYPKPLGSNKLFCEMIDKAVKEEFGNMNKNTKAAYTYALKRLLPTFAELPLSKITPERIMKFQQDKLKEGVAPATIALDTALMSKAFSAAQRWKWIEINPCSKVKRLKVDNKRVRYLKEDEVERLHSAMPEWLKSIVTVARFTGLRITNILELTWDDVNLFSKTIIIKKTKNGQPLGLPMANTVYEVFKKLNRVRRIDTKFLFLNRQGEKFSRDVVSTTFKSICVKIGIEDFRFHDLRHDFCSMLAQRGVDLYTIGALAGHRDYKSTLRYSHLSPEKLRKDIDLLDRPMTQISHNRYMGENSK